MSSRPLAPLSLAASKTPKDPLPATETVSDAYYHQYAAAVHGARQVRLAASRGFLARCGVRGADHIAAGAETP